MCITVLAIASCSPEDGKDGINGENGKDGINGVDGKDGVDGTNGESAGATHLVLTGSITNEEAQAKIEAEVGVSTKFIIIRNTTQLTSITIPGVEELIDVSISNNDNLTEISMPNTKVVVGSLAVRQNSKLTKMELSAIESMSQLSFEYNPAITELGWNSLRTYNELEIALNDGLQTINFENLQTPNAGSDGFIRIHSNNALTTVLFDALQSSSLSLTFNPILSRFSSASLVETESIALQDNNNMTIINTPKLRRIGSMTISDLNKLKSFSLGSIEEIGRLSIYRNAILETIEAPVLKKSEQIQINSNPVLTSIALPALETLTEIANNGSSIISDCSRAILDVSYHPLLVDLSLPRLKSVDDAAINVTGNSNLTEVDLNSIEGRIGSLLINRNGSLNSISANALEEYINIDIHSNKELLTVSFLNLRKQLNVTHENCFLGFNTNETIIEFDFRKTNGVLSIPKLEELHGRATLNFTGVRNIDLSKLTTFSELRILTPEELESINLSNVKSFENFYIDNLKDVVATSILASFAKINTPVLSNANIEINVSDLPTTSSDDIETLIDNGNSVNIY